MFTQIDSSLGPRSQRIGLVPLDDCTQPASASSTDDEAADEVTWLIELRERVEAMLASVVAQLDYEGIECFAAGVAGGVIVCGRYTPLAAFLQAEDHLGRFLSRAKLLRIAW